ncbi:MAG: T9SS type A sorting domain-containing protein, partial [Saprospiraceae bacterium]
VFERNGNVLLPFISQSTPGNPKFKYAPEYTSKFPPIINFMAMHDFNDDGKKDIFALSKKSSAIEVWRNTSDNNGLSFEFMKFSFGLGDFLQIASNGNFVNLYASSIDLPSIIDTDGDGDLDILAFEPGGSYMYHYKNLAKEMGLTDTLIYRLTDLCWGNFFESGVSEEISLSEDRSKCSAGLQDNTGIGGGVRHSGSTVTTFDGDGDGDLDMLLGDLTNNGLVYLENDKVDGDDFMISQDLNYPENSIAVEMNIFLGSFFLDVDNDGKRDLIVAPNNPLGSENINHIWYYHNSGTDSAPVFDFVQNDFMLDQTLVMGKSSSVTFIDYNADGLLDILVGNDGIVTPTQKSSALFLYKNIGTTTAPKYTLINDDYLNLKAAYGSNGAYFAPTIGDIDGDGDSDLLIGDKRGYLLYFENTAGVGLPYEFAPYIYKYMDIKVGTNVKPFLFDVDNDGLTDIILGEKNDNADPVTGLPSGGLNFIKNIGSIGNPMFEADEELGENTPIMGRVYTKDINQTSGESAPFFFESEGELMLSVGSRGGNIHVYNDIADSIYGTFNEIFERLPILHCGRRSINALADIDNDDYYEILVANDNGGLRAFNTTFRVKGDVSTNDFGIANVLLSPNPASNNITITSDIITNGDIHIYNTVGLIVYKNKYYYGATIDIKHLPKGVYFLKLSNENLLGIEKFSKI